MKEMKAPDKVTQKMTHDGAVTENLATGEITNITVELLSAMSERKRCFLVIRSPKDDDRFILQLIPFKIEIAFNADFGF